MRAEAHEFEGRGVWLAINQNEVGPDMAVAMIVPLAGKPMIEIAPRWRHVCGE
jgi:hypothetical protein